MILALDTKLSTNFLLSAGHYLALLLRATCLSVCLSQQDTAVFLVSGDHILWSSQTYVLKRDTPCQKLKFDCSNCSISLSTKIHYSVPYSKIIYL